ncbi:MAG: EsaB/YukD family protein [Lachnospiraceae bacterium]|nr:EsaB/YukD family protein [Lachnospiraceae bacterium]
MGETATVIFTASKRNIHTDIEVPLGISANELVIALNEAYNLKIDISSVKNCFLKAERPIALLRGDKTLGEFGVRNGTIIIFSD